MTVNGNDHPRADHEGPEREYRYSSTLSLTSKLDGLGRQRHATVALPPEKILYIHRTAGAPGPVWAGAKNLAPAPPPEGFEPRTNQPVASRHTD